MLRRWLLVACCLCLLVSISAEEPAAAGEPSQACIAQIPLTVLRVERLNLSPASGFMQEAMAVAGIRSVVRHIGTNSLLIGAASPAAVKAFREFITAYEERFPPRPTFPPRAPVTNSPSLPRFSALVPLHNIAASSLETLFAGGSGGMRQLLPKDVDELSPVNAPNGVLVTARTAKALEEACRLIAKLDLAIKRLAYDAYIIKVTTNLLPTVWPSQYSWPYSRYRGDTVAPSDQRYVMAPARYRALLAETTGVTVTQVPRVIMPNGGTGCLEGLPGLRGLLVTGITLHPDYTITQTVTPLLRVPEGAAVTCRPSDALAVTLRIRSGEGVLLKGSSLGLPPPDAQHTTLVLLTPAVMPDDAKTPLVLPEVY
jgi:hypothetical protein